MKKIFYALIALTFLIFSCKKPVILLPDITPGAKLNGLSGTSWKIIASSAVIDYGGGLIMEYDLFSALPLCNTDNISWFLADGTTSTDEGPTKCDPLMPQYAVNGNWTLSSDKKKLVLTTTVPNVVGLTKLDCEVLQLDASIMILRYITYYNGPKSVTTTTYKRVN